MKQRSVIHKMKAGWKALFAGLALACAAGPASAAVLVYFDPTPRIVGPGGSSTVNLMVSGLGTGVSPSLGSWSVEFSFDPTIVSFTGFAWGDGLDLGDDVTGSLFQIGAIDNVLGSVTLLEASAQDPADLNTFQPDTFVLATLSFTGDAIGSTPLSFVPVLTDLGNEDGSGPVPHETVDGRIIVRDDGTRVPETLGLLPAASAFALLLFLGTWKSKRRAHLHA